VDFKETYQPRIERFMKSAKEKGIESLLFYSNVWRREDSRYLAGFNFLGPFNMLLITADGNVRMGVSCTSDFRKAKEEIPWLEEVILEGPEMGKVAKAWGKIGLKGAMGVSGLDLIPIRLLREMKGSGSGMTLVPIADLVNQIRLIKSPEELRLIRRSAAIGDKAYLTFLESVRDGRNAYEIMADVERTVKLEGAEDNFMIVGVGGVEVMAMAPPKDRVPVKGDQVLTEVPHLWKGTVPRSVGPALKGSRHGPKSKGLISF
jgi:Xaa-Pro aminopeptidase